MSEGSALTGVRLAPPWPIPAAAWAAAGADILQQLGAVRSDIAGSHRLRPARPARGGGRESLVVVGVDGSVMVRSASPSPTAGRVVPVLLVGAHAALTALAALRVAEGRGRRVVVDLNAAEVIAACSGDALARIACPHRAPAAPVETETIACADGYVAVGQLSDRCRVDLALLAGRDPSTVASVEVRTAVETWLRRLTRREVVELAALWRLPFAPVQRRDEALAAAARGEFGRPFEVSLAGPAPAAGGSRRAGPLPLSGVVALDLGVAWSGPYCAALLHDLGARVIRVERPGAAMHHVSSGSMCAGASSDLRAGKELVELDLATGTGRDRFLGLVRDADIVVQNFSRRVMTNLGLGRAELHATNPALITVAMPAFPAESPWSQHIAYGGGLECATGLADFESGPLPRPASVPYVDYLAGAYAAIAALALLRARDRSGLGGDAIVAQQAVAGRVLQATGADGVRYHPEPFISAMARDLADSGFIGPTEGPHRHRSRPPWSFAIVERVPRRAGFRGARRGGRAGHSARLG